MSFLQLRSPSIQNTLANPPVVGTAYSIDALAGTYAVTGFASTFLNNRAIASLAGAYAITGASAATVTQRQLAALSGAYNVTGASAAPVAGRIVLSGTGAVAVTGAAAFLTRGVSLEASAGAVTATGANAGLFAARLLFAGNGSFVIVGSAADIVTGVPPEAGVVLQRFDAVYNRGVSVTPSDTVNVDGTSGTASKPVASDALYVGASGTVALVLENGDVVSFAVSSGYVLPVRYIRVNSTATTASQLVALYSV